MFVPFQPASRRRRRGRSLTLAISLTVALGLVGVYVNLPPLGPPGVNPPPDVNPLEGNGWKKCPNCGTAVQPEQTGHCICPNCDEEFKAADAEDYS